MNCSNVLGIIQTGIPTPLHVLIHEKMKKQNESITALKKEINKMKDLLKEKKSEKERLSTEVNHTNQAKHEETNNARPQRTIAKETSRREPKLPKKQQTDHRGQSFRDEKTVEISRLKSKIKTDARVAAKKLEEKQNIIKELQAQIKVLQVENDLLKQQLPTKT